MAADQPGTDAAPRSSLPIVMYQVLPTRLLGLVDLVSKRLCPTQGSPPEEGVCGGRVERGAEADGNGLVTHLRYLVCFPPPTEQGRSCRGQHEMSSGA